MKYHVACRDCVANHDCLFQNNDDAESCGDVQDFDSGLDFPDRIDTRAAALAAGGSKKEGG